MFSDTNAKTGGQRKILLGLVAQLNQCKTGLGKKGLKTMYKPNQRSEGGLNLACVQPFPPLPSNQTGA